MRLRRPRSAGARAIALLALLPAAALAAALLPPHEAFALSARALDPHTLEARFNVADGYYLYRDKLKFNLDGAAPMPIAPELPAGKIKHDDFFGDVETYRGLLVIRLPLPTAQASHKLTLMTESQGCADVGVCYPPQRQVLTLDIPAVGAGPSEVVAAPIGRPAWLK
jgi:thioredoxin:protein disulfide reductase